MNRNLDLLSKDYKLLPLIFLSSVYYSLSRFIKLSARDYSFSSREPLPRLPFVQNRRTTHFPLNLTTYSRGCNRRIDDESPSSSLLSTGCLWPFTIPLSTSFVFFKISKASNVFLRHSRNL